MPHLMVYNSGLSQDGSLEEVCMGGGEVVGFKIDCFREPERT
jgi:hypothetical protein